MEKEDIIVRAETPRDYPTIYALNNAAFGRTEEAKLVDSLRSSSAFVKGLSLVATKNDIVVGHILFTEVKVVDTINKHVGLSLAPMAVTPNMQGEGIGSKLINKGLQLAKAAGYSFVLVLGHESFYPKFGFRPANYWNIKTPFNVPTNAFMALELEKDALENIEGMVQYPKELTI